MARLEAQSKLLYYPTPNEIVDLIASWFRAAQPVRLADPCCGTGEALRRFADALGVKTETWGVELSNSRAAQAAQVLDHVLPSSFYAMTPSKWSSASVGLLFNNPPYDWGDRRAQFSLIEIYEAYLQRYDLEHFFRFGKQKLLLDKFQTPDDRHEANWWLLVALAYLQLWAAKDLVTQLPRPWERYLPSVLNKVITPAAAQRDMSRIIKQIGTPSSVPKPRGKSPGRLKGTVLVPRRRLVVVKKAKT